MKKWNRIDQTLTPDGKTLVLYEHDGSFTIRIDGVDLMSTRQHASEEKLAELACAHLRNVRGPRILIGGLGFGFTLRAALSVLPPDAAVLQVEILAAVIAWNQNRALPLAADALADARVKLLCQDVARVIHESPGTFDSIILDVDNGPAAFSTAGNSRLYDSDGLLSARNALRPGGCAIFWSAKPDPAFEKLMTRAGFIVSVHSCRSRQRAGSRHTLFLGRHPGFLERHPGHARSAV